MLRYFKSDVVSPEKYDELKGQPRVEDCETLADVLRVRALLTPEKTAYVFLRDGDSDALSLTYGQLDAQVRDLAALLQTQTKKGDRVLLLYPQGLEFVVGFFACLYAGTVAVLVYPPQNQRMAERMSRIVEDCQVRCLLSDQATAGRLDKFLSEGGADESGRRSRELLGSIPWLLSDSDARTSQHTYREVGLQGADLAFLQYTSGSTGSPKGVMVSHGSLMANQACIQELFGHSEKSVMVSWLPVLHDMGLVGSTLQPLYAGFPLVFMTPLHFMQKPVRWLRAISKYGGTTSGGPNFAYDLCINKITAEQMKGLDLSSWQVAYNGSEPVRKETLAGFLGKFAEFGLKKSAQMPVYGLAEATLLVSAGENQEGPFLDGETGYVGCGRSPSGHEIAIVDPDTKTRVLEGERGEVWFGGKSVASGYWGRPEQSQETFGARLSGSEETYLRTGDIGYMKGGHLHLSGRMKDLIIVRGRNYHAEDLEWSLRSLGGARTASAAAFLLDENNAESLTIVLGIGGGPAEDYQAVYEQVSQRIYEDYQLSVKRVVLIRAANLPRTTSGKVQRRLTRQMYQAGDLKIVDERELGGGGFREGACDARHPSELPANEEEKRLAKIWSEVLSLPLETIGRDDNFFTLGGHSLLMLELAGRLDANLEVLFRYPTIRSFSEQSGEYEFPETAPDVYLPEARLDEHQPSPTNLSLITGGNGLFGVHLLKSLLQATEDHFYVLVRGDTEEHVSEKFWRNVDYFDLRKFIDPARITLVRGDFSKERLGLSDETYDKFARAVQRIYHIGSHVNNWLPYEGIKAVNVVGTRELLTLARTHRAKEFHYASTSTFSPKKEDDSVFYEVDDIEPRTLNKYNGYDISKYVSEELCKLARKDGISTNIYRLVWVGGQLDSGLCKLNDGFNIMLRILIKLGAFPEGNYLHDIIPVDVMADAVASVQGKTENAAFNITSQSNESIDMKKIVTMLREFGYHIEEVTRGEFVRRLRAYPDAEWDEHCRSYRQLVIRLFDEEIKPESFYDATNLRTHASPEVLAKLEEPFVDKWFRKAVLFLVRKGALPTPQGGLYEQDLEAIRGFNATKVERPELALHQLFEAQVEKDPTALCVCDSGYRVSYGELNDRANRIARLLIERGVKREELVGLCVARSADLYAGVLGIMKAGAAYVPLDPTYPREHLKYMIEDSSVRYTLTSTSTDDALSGLDTGRLCLGSKAVAQEMSQFGSQEIRLHGVDVKPSSLAYVIYTSGSTGKPKGVMIEHAAAANHSLHMRDAFELTPADNVLQFATMNFDSFIEEVFPAFARGAAISVIPDAARRDVAELKKVIVQSGVTVLKFPTAYFHGLVEESFEGLGVRLLGIGGEEADVAKFRRWHRTNPNIPVINTYGPTETAVTASVAPLEPEMVDAERLPIGPPISNMVAKVVDETGYETPISVVGELLLSGAGLARGYLNRPDETAKAFVVEDGARWYRTGDLVRWTSSGQLEFFGREDAQVKVRGYRIELGAIESCLAELPLVKEAAVVVDRNSGGARLLAYYVCSDEGREKNLGEGLRESLKTRIPSYSVPEIFIRLDSLPMNPNGKVDRLDLERRPVDPALAESSYVPPATETERKLCEVWQQLLGVARVGVNDDFLDLGGHSLLAIQLLQRIRQEFEARLGVEEFYASRTVRELALAIDQPTEALSEPCSLVEFPGSARESARSLFLFHGVGGNVASFYPLAKRLSEHFTSSGGQGCRIWGVQQNAQCELEIRDMDELVVAYAEKILAVQSQGPFWLGGWSFGVSLAQLVGKELERRGHVVESFVSIDAEAPTEQCEVRAFFEAQGISASEHLYKERNLRLALQQFGYKFGFSPRSFSDVKTQLNRFLGYPSGLGKVQRDQYNMLAIANMFRAAGIRPEPLEGTRYLLLKASESKFEDYESGWAELIPSGRLMHREVVGDHWSIMGRTETAEPIVEFLSQN